MGAANGGHEQALRDVVARYKKVYKDHVGSDVPQDPLVQLEAATLLSGAGNGAALVLLPWLVLELTGSAGSAGLLAAATAVPLLPSSPGSE